MPCQGSEELLRVPAVCSHVILSIQERLSVGSPNADDFFRAKKGNNLWLRNTLHKGHDLV